MSWYSRKTQMSFHSDNLGRQDESHVLKTVLPYTSITIRKAFVQRAALNCTVNWSKQGSHIAITMKQCASIAGIAAGFLWP